MPLLQPNRMSLDAQLQSAHERLDINERELLTVTPHHKSKDARRRRAKIKQTMKFLRKRIRKLESLIAERDAIDEIEIPVNSFFSPWWHHQTKKHRER